MAEPSPNITGPQPRRRSPASATDQPVAREALGVLEDAFQTFERISVSFSGAEDVVLIDLGTRILGSDLPVFSLDTGRLHPETHRFMETVREHYGVAIETLAPDPVELAGLVRAKGLFSFYRDGHGECCAIRKIEPLGRKLEHLDAWITGQRADQSVTREGLPIVQDDLAFSSAQHPIRKYNPLANWTGEDVWDYIRRREVPYNPLHDQGFRSIGCEPCTRPVGPHQHEREGRWWWENVADKECGLHAQNVAEPLRIIDR